MKTFLCLLALVAYVNGHGYMIAPQGRVVWCREGTGNFPGLWWEAPDHIPDQSCRMAWHHVANQAREPTSQFAELNGYSGQNPRGYTNPQDLATITGNAQVCSVGRVGFSGFEIAAPWRYNTIAASPGASSVNVEFTFCATAPHEPSEWKVYGTGAGFNPQANIVQWDRLFHVGTIGNIPPIKLATAAPLCYSFGAPHNIIYRFNMQVPIHQLGTLVVVWQRFDSTEFFLQCMDYQRVTQINTNVDGERQTAYRYPDERERCPKMKETSDGHQSCKPHNKYEARDGSYEDVYDHEAEPVHRHH